MELQTMYAEYEYRRRIAQTAKPRASIWRRVMG